VTPACEAANDDSEGEPATPAATPDITPDVANLLGHYVYVYVDPRDGEVFYIGKGVGARAMAHLVSTGETRKAIRDAVLEPRIDVVAHKLRDDEEAFRVEAALIEHLETARLTNEVRGWRSTESRRKFLADFVMECAPRWVDVTDPCLLIRINKLFRFGGRLATPLRGEPQPNIC
jgi:hypothetical protein